MKTTFTIAADTTAMTVVLSITQNGKRKYHKRFTTVTEAALFLLDGIGTVMERQATREVEEDLADQTARQVEEERHELDSTYEIDGERPR